MGMDLRATIGLLFTILGLLIGGYGLLSNQAIYARSLGINVNFEWGAVLLLFGLTMLAFAWRASRKGA
jgi:hypothetical protein